MLISSPLSRPSLRTESSVAVISRLFLGVSVLGLLPALYGLYVGASMTLAMLDGHLAPSVGLRAVGLVAFLLVGLAQAGFYLLRSRAPVRRARGWWLSTAVYNALIAVGATAFGIDAARPLVVLAVVPYLGLAYVALRARALDLGEVRSTGR